MPTAGDQHAAPEHRDAAAPAGRYGSSGSRQDRGLKITGAVLGALLLTFIGWAGISYIGGQTVTGELTGFTVLSDTEVEVTVQVRKSAGTGAVCTVRSQAFDGLEVGRADFRFEEDGDTVHRAHTLRTTARATSAELLSCDAAGD
ncbi:DUF4307 domain-containing protein [Streptomyces otsuchiensis]|uniref:DUF4307 domain-containing protein n=1 Tax=Streptomyces otsuchiensis TaxID=2681388 RepID=UPI001031B1B0|nr:DUF4307 domain-containing protein [Streptomyces otsuchiensis]